jgi:hypothetical protein
MSNATRRKAGYYWVKTSNRWQIALWEADGWALHGVEGVFDDSDFEDIQEHPIRTLEGVATAMQKMEETDKPRKARPTQKIQLTT